jgi:hypothetical protein
MIRGSNCTIPFGFFSGRYYDRDAIPSTVIRRFRTIISFNLTYLVGVCLEVERETRD